MFLNDYRATRRERAGGVLRRTRRRRAGSCSRRRRQPPPGAPVPRGDRDSAPPGAAGATAEGSCAQRRQDSPAAAAAIIRSVPVMRSNSGASSVSRSAVSSAAVWSISARTAFRFAAIRSIAATRGSGGTRGGPTDNQGETVRTPRLMHIVEDRSCHHAGVYPGSPCPATIMVPSGLGTGRTHPTNRMPWPPSSPLAGGMSAITVATA